jgi:hypothetical protein
MRFFRFPRFGDWSSCERRRRADVDAKKCDENCDGSSDFAAKTDTIDRFQLNRISKLSVINARCVHPAYRPVRHFLMKTSLLSLGQTITNLPLSPYSKISQQ